MDELLSLSQHNSTLIEIIKQTSVEEQKITKNGQTQRIHVVVKNSPFQFGCALRNNKISNFNHLTFDIKLIYDLENEEDVSLAQGCEPMEYKPTINDLGDQIDFDVKIKVLSSHLNNLNFRLKLTVWDPNTPVNSFPQLTITSAPIRVISKPLKHRKRAPPTPNTPTRITGKRGRNSSSSHPPSNPVSSLPSVPTQDLVLHEAVKRLERNQTEQLNLLKQIASVTNTLPLSMNTPNELPISRQQQLLRMSDALTNPLAPPAKRLKKEGEFGGNMNDSLIELPNDRDKIKEFETAFSSMLRAFGSMTGDERVERVRNMMRRLTARDAETAFEMIDLLLTHGLRFGKETPKTMSYGSAHQIPTSHHQPTIIHHANCTCATCQNARGLPGMDDFYSEFLF